MPGPSTQAGPYEVLCDGGQPRIYVERNIGPHQPDPEGDPWAIVGYGYGEQGVAPREYQASERFPTHPGTVTGPKEAFEAVLQGAGATLPARDAVDRRVAADVRSRTGCIIDSPDQVGAYPRLATGEPPVDSDNDGMPDAWETEHGLDPHDPSDQNRDQDQDGYTNIEEYLHSLRR